MSSEDLQIDNTFETFNEEREVNIPIEGKKLQDAKDTNVFLIINYGVEQEKGL